MCKLGGGNRPMTYKSQLKQKVRSASNNIQINKIPSNKGCFVAKEENKNSVGKLNHNQN